MPFKGTRRSGRVCSFRTPVEEPGRKLRPRPEKRLARQGNPRSPRGRLLRSARTTYCRSPLPRHRSTTTMRRPQRAEGMAFRVRVLNDQHRQLVSIVVPFADDYKRSPAKVNRVPRLPVRHRCRKRRRFRRLTLRRFQPEQESSHPVSPLGWGPDGSVSLIHPIGRAAERGELPARLVCVRVGAQTH